jgi:HK97 family phage major capsid protein
VDAVEESVEAEQKSISTIPEEENKMDENIVENEVKAEEPEVDIKAIADEIRKSIVEELKAAPGIERGERTIKAPAVIDGLGEKSYKSAFWDYVRTGEVSNIRKASKAALQEGTTTEGGYLVPDDEYGSIIAKRDEESIISKLGLMRVTTNRDKYNFPTENASLAKFTLVAEEGAISAAEEEPTFAQVSVPVYKFTKLIKISEELLEDENSNLEAFLTNAIGRAVADTENYYALIGAGSTEPQGAFVGGTAGLSFDSASAIGAAEIPELMGKLGSPYHTGAAWVMDPATWFYLKGLSGNPFVFTSGVARLSGTVDGPTLEGYPVVLNSNVANIAASAKSLMFGNFNYMGFVTNRGLRIRRLNELYADTGQVGILATYRFGCAVLQAEAFQYATHPSA